LTGFNRSKEKDLPFLGVNVLIEIDKLRIKLIKLLNSNNMNYKMSGIGGDDARETMTQSIREIDPQTFRVLMDLVLEPARKDLFFKILPLLSKVKNLLDRITKRVFLANLEEVNNF